MAFAIFLKYGGEVVQLPVNPSEFVMPTEGANETAEIVSLGEVTVIKRPKLTDYTISSYFPKWTNAPYVTAKTGVRTADKYIAFINKIRVDRKPCALIVSDIGLSVLVSIESFEISYVAPSDDTYYTLVLKRYVPFAAKELTVEAKPSAITQKAIAPAPERPNTGGQIAIGSTVIATGVIRYDSYGSKPHGKLNNYKGKVSNIVKNPKSGQNYTIHVTSLTGGWLGWMSKSEVTLA